MSVRSRKREHYRRILGRSNSVLLQSRSAKKCCIQGWKAIRRDVRRVFGADSAMAWEWFITPAMALNNQSPVDLVVAGDLQLVRDHLTKLEYGVYM